MNNAIFGTWQVGSDGWSTVDHDAAFDALKLAVERGFEIDTAPTYGDGEAEKLVGRVLRETGARPRIITKVPPDRMGREQVKASVVESLERLGCDSVDTVLIHWPAGTMGTPEVPLDETARGLEELRSAGLARRVGICNYDLAGLKAYDERIGVDAVQYAFSLLFSPAAREILPYAQSRNMEFQAYSPLGQGLLAGGKPYQNLPARDPRAYVLLFREQYSADVAHARERFLDIVGANRHPAAVALWWVRSKGAIPVVGAHTREHVLQLVEDDPLVTADDIERLEVLAKDSRAHFSNFVSLWG